MTRKNPSATAESKLSLSYRRNAKAKLQERQSRFFGFSSSESESGPLHSAKSKDCEKLGPSNTEIDARGVAVDPNSVSFSPGGRKRSKPETRSAGEAVLSAVKRRRLFDGRRSYLNTYKDPPTGDDERNDVEVEPVNSQQTVKIPCFRDAHKDAKSSGVPEGGRRRSKTSPKNKKPAKTAAEKIAEARQNLIKVPLVNIVQNDANNNEEEASKSSDGPISGEGASGNLCPETNRDVNHTLEDLTISRLEMNHANGDDFSPPAESTRFEATSPVFKTSTTKPAQKSSHKNPVCDASTITESVHESLICGCTTVGNRIVQKVIEDEIRQMIRRDFKAYSIEKANKLFAKIDKVLDEI